jgi:hypothetical protein
VAEALSEEQLEVRQEIYFKIVDKIEDLNEFKKIIKEVPESINKNTARTFWEKWISENN